MHGETLEVEEEKKEGGMLGMFLARACDSGPITKDTEGEHVAFRNNMQFVLALRKSGDTGDHSVVKMWLTEHSADFGRAFDEVIDKDPLYFDGYATLDDIPEEKWREIESHIYNKES